MIKNITSSKINCICCDDSLTVNLKYKPKAHFYGQETTFDYYYCSDCEILWRDQTENIQLDQYDDNYYSFVLDNSWKKKLKTVIQSIIFNINYYLSIQLMRNEYILYRVFKQLKVNKDSSILDIGCGGGAFLERLYSYGYKNIQGIDPYIKSSATKDFPVLPISVFDLKDKFEFINIHHVLEHISDPVKFLEKVYESLEIGGKAIITFPRFSKVVEEDGENSYLIQAPDHNVLFSDKCFRKITEKIGFKIEYSEIDSSGTFEWLVIGKLWSKNINVKCYDNTCLKHLTDNQIFAIRTKSALFEKNEDGANILYIIRR